MHVDDTLRADRLVSAARELFELSGHKILALDGRWEPGDGGPVFTVGGRYTTRGWTEWTHGFQVGSALLQFEATGDDRFLDIGRRRTHALMPRYVTHTGVHDHGFNIVSTYGNLLRMMREGTLPDDAAERRCLELALRASGAVQASRWTRLSDTSGYVYSFNGRHSLFADTIRSMRVLALADRLGHVLLGEGDRQIDLLDRLLQHAETTARFNVYFGEGRDAWDVRGRVAHESIFNVDDGSYRCASTQQGYSPFTTWTRALAWVLLGYAELLEFLDTVPEQRLSGQSGRAAVLDRFRRVAEAVADYYIAETASDGIPYWDTGAPGLSGLGDWRQLPADPWNDREPVDSSAATIAAQGLLRLAAWLEARNENDAARRYRQAGLTVASALLSDRYLTRDSEHEGLILHAVYHRPRGWDHIPAGRRIPCGEASSWGDYHARELALLLLRQDRGQPAPTFFGIKPHMNDPT